MRFLSPASFWSPDYICQSGWIEHAPFAFWICDALRPRRFVELGTHYGYSYFAFCQAIERLALGTAAYAVDTWQGDEHAGYYDENVFNAVAQQNAEKYANFSQLIRSSFDEALQRFEDRSIDLLHIDGRHFYSDVKHDFETWRPKLSDNAIVLFHDTSVREREFGVWQLFEELSGHYPAFQFFHGNGLGILATGEAPAALSPLFEASDQDAEQIRAVYAGLGSAISVRLLQGQLAERETQLIQRETQLIQRDARLAEQNAQLIEKEAWLEEQTVQIIERDGRLEELNAQLAERSTQLAERTGQLHECVYHLDRINAWGWFRLGVFLDRLIHDPLGVLAKRQSSASENQEQSSVSKNDDLKALRRQQYSEALAAFLTNGERIKLPTSDVPDVSIILVLSNGAELTLECLKSLRTAIDVPAEVLIVDNASNDQTRELLARVDGAKIMENSENLHFLRAVNQAAPKSRGKHVLLLNNDTSLKAGPIRVARDLLDKDATIGAVGGKIVLLDGALQEAGSIIWRDGTCLGYGRGRNPSEPEFQFRRDVDYCSGAFLMLRRNLFEKLGWLNEQFIPAYYEETDLCMRIRAAGSRVVYEPMIEVSHFEFGSSASSDAALALQERNHATFSALHQRELGAGHLPQSATPFWARMRPTSQRILIIDDRVPYPELGAGFPRATEIIRAVYAAGWFITVYPLTFPFVSWERAYRLLPREIEIAADRGDRGLAEFLKERIDYYDAVLVSRPHNMKIFHQACEQVPEFLEHTHLIYDAEALFTAREALRVALKSRPFTEKEYKEKLAEEMALAGGAMAILAVSEQEAGVFRANCHSSVHVVGHSLIPRPTPRLFEGRANILFVGALCGNQEISPNIDGIMWFVREVMPLLDKRLGEGYKLLVAGLVESDDVRQVAGPRVEFLGTVPDLTAVYGRARLFIAPTRFAAGIPHKVQEASAAGLPVVATQLIAKQLNRSDLAGILTANTPAEFSEACYRLYSDPVLWKKIRESALECVGSECDGSRFAQSISDVLAEVPRLRKKACSGTSSMLTDVLLPLP